MFQNTPGSFHIWGFEVPVKYELTDNTTADVSYGFAKVINDEVAMKYPSHQVKLNLTSRYMEDRLKVGMSYVFNSKYTHEQLAQSSFDRAYEDDRNLVDLWATYQVNKNLRFKGIIQNFFGDRTPPPGDQMDNPEKAKLGYDAIRVYLSAEITF
jgi:outer membrane receptor for ferric coprogen and ferric-rhodotorulic acid